MAEPLKIRAPAGRHAVCACGRTANAPFCDGTHAGTGVAPELIDLATESVIAWCTCRRSGILPMCDGSHRCT